MIGGKKPGCLPSGLPLLLLELIHSFTTILRPLSSELPPRLSHRGTLFQPQHPAHYLGRLLLTAQTVFVTMTFQFSGVVAIMVPGFQAIFRDRGFRRTQSYGTYLLLGITCQVWTANADIGLSHNSRHGSWREWESSTGFWNLG